MKKVISIILGPCLAATAFAGPQPWAPSYWYVTFRLDLQAWHATDIIIVNEGEEIDGKVRVEEVLRGSKTRGEELDFPGLAKLADPEARTRFVPDVGAPPMMRLLRPDELNASKEGLKTEVIPGKRMILFLGGGGEEIVLGYTSGTMEVPPKPEVVEHPITRNVALIDGERVFGASGRLDAPNIPFVDLDVSVREVREIVAEIEAGRERMEQCVAIEDAETRAAEAASLARSGVYRVQKKGLEILFGCGAEAIPHIQAYLDENGFDGRIAKLLDEVRAIQWKKEADFQEGDFRPDERFTPPLIYLADKEIAFWKRTVPTLEVDWWIGRTDDAEMLRRVGNLQHRAGLTAKVVYALGAIEANDTHEKLVEMRDFFQSDPRLRGDEGPGLYRTCLATLGELTAEKRRELDFGNPGGGR